MSVIVDSLFATKRSRRWPYVQACHLRAETDAELIQFASRLGLKREWAQSMDHPQQRRHHFDLTANMRRKAILLGAESVDGWPFKEDR